MNKPTDAKWTATSMPADQEKNIMSKYLILIIFIVFYSVAYGGERDRRRHRRDYDDPMHILSYVLGAVGGNNNAHRRPPPPPPSRRHRDRYPMDDNIRVIRIIPTISGSCIHPSNNKCTACGASTENTMEIQGETWSVNDVTKSSLDDNLVVVTLKSTNGKIRKILQNVKTKQFKFIEE